MTILRSLSTTLICAVACYFAASVLWLFPGRTVTEGPFFATATCLIALVLAFLLTIRINKPERRLTQQRWYLVAMRSVVLAAVVVAWLLTKIYLIGWLAAFAAVVLAVAGLWQLLADLVATPVVPNDTRAGTTTMQRRLKLATTHAVETAVGIAGVVITTPIHQWRLEIISPLVVIVSAAMLLALLIVRLIGTDR